MASISLRIQKSKFEFETLEPCLFLRPFLVPQRFLRRWHLNTSPRLALKTKREHRSFEEVYTGPEAFFGLGGGSIPLFSQKDCHFCHGLLIFDGVGVAKWI